jgi:hypothetical protein
MHSDMNKSMKSIFLTIFSGFCLLSLAKIVIMNEVQIATWTTTEILLYAIVLIMVAWILFSNMFDAFDGVGKCINHHILHKTPCE